MDYELTAQEEAQATNMSEPTVVPSSNALPTTTGANGNGTSTPVVINRGAAAGGSGGSSGTFGVKTGLAQMLKGG